MVKERGKKGTQKDERADAPREERLSRQETISPPNPSDSLSDYVANVVSKFVNDAGIPATFDDLLATSKLRAALEPDANFQTLLSAVKTEGGADESGDGIANKPSISQNVPTPAKPSTSQETPAPVSAPGVASTLPAKTAAAPDAIGKAVYIDPELTASAEKSDTHTTLGTTDPLIVSTQKDALTKGIMVKRSVEFLTQPTVVRDTDFWRITAFGLEGLDEGGFERDDEKTNFLADIVAEVMVASELKASLALNDFGSTVQSGYPESLYVSDSDKVRVKLAVYENWVNGPFMATVGQVIAAGVPARNAPFGVPAAFDPAVVVVAGGAPVPQFHPYVLSHTHLVNGLKHKTVNAVGRSAYLWSCRDLLERRFQNRIGVTAAMIDSIRSPMVGFLDRIYNPRIIRGVYTRVGNVDAYNAEKVKAYRFERVQLDATTDMFSGLMDVAVNVELGKEARERSYAVARSSIASEISPSQKDSNAFLSGEDQSMMTVISPTAAHSGIVSYAAWCAGGSNMSLGVNHDDPLFTEVDNALAPLAAFAFLLLTPSSHMEPVDFRKTFSVMMKVVLPDDDANLFTQNLLGSGYGVRLHMDPAATRANHNAAYAAVLPAFPAFAGNPGMVGGRAVPNAMLRFINMTANRRLVRTPDTARMFSAVVGGAVLNTLKVNGGVFDHTPFVPFTPDLAPNAIFTTEVLGLRMGAESSNLRYVHHNNHATAEIARMRLAISEFFDFLLFNLSVRIANMHRKRKGDLSTFFASYMRAGLVNTLLSAGIVNFAVLSAFDNSEAIPPFADQVYRAAQDPNIMCGDVVRLDMAYALSFLLLGVNVDSAQQQYKNSLVIKQPSSFPMYYKVENFVAIRVLESAAANAIGLKIISKYLHVTESTVKECLLFQAMVHMLKKMMEPQPGYERRLAYYRRRFLELLVVALPAGAPGRAAIAAAVTAAMVPLTRLERRSLENGNDSVLRTPPPFYRGRENYAVVTFIKPVQPYMLPPSSDALGVDDLSRVMVHGAPPGFAATYLRDADVFEIDRYIGQVAAAFGVRQVILGGPVPAGMLQNQGAIPTLRGLAAFSQQGAATAAKLRAGGPGGLDLIVPYTSIRLVHDHLASGGQGISFGPEDLDTEDKLIKALKALKKQYIRLQDGYTTCGFVFPVRDGWRAPAEVDLLTIMATSIIGCSLTTDPGLEACFVPVVLTRLDVSAQVKPVPLPTLEMKGHSGVIKTLVSSVPLVYYTLGRADPLPRFLQVHTIPMSRHLEHVIVRSDPDDPPYGFPRMLGYLLGTDAGAAYKPETEIIEVYKRDEEEILDGRTLLDKVGLFAKPADGVA